MVSFLEEQESFVCKFNPIAEFKSSTVNDLIITAFGHASAFILCSSIGPTLKTIATISCQYHNETKDIFILYQHSNTVVASATEAFKSMFVNDVLQLIFTHLQFSRATILGTIPTLNYEFGKHQTNTLLWVGTNGCKVDIKKTGRVDPGIILGNVIGAGLVACEVAGKECYAFLGIMQEYSISRSSLKVFEPINEILDYIKTNDDESYVKKRINEVNGKLENHLFL